jgi:hypothetical protein
MTDDHRVTRSQDMTISVRPDWPGHLILRIQIEDRWVNVPLSARFALLLGRNLIEGATALLQDPPEKPS